MIAEVDAELVVAARGGDAGAVEQLVVDYLPLVYNIVGHALQRGADVDDTVQETMLHVVRGLPGLRDPAAFRSWLVAICMNEVRRQRRQRVPELHPLEAFDALVEPVSDFADGAIWELGLTGQRRETAEAALWLDDQDRELMSLWFLVEAGQLSRAEMAAALEVSAHTATVRIARMKAQLDVARGIVRALAVTPLCSGLAAVAADGWSGSPSGLWRKRFARHIRGCEDCLSLAADLIPADHLLPGLMAPPLGLVGLVSSKLVRPETVRPFSPHRLAHMAAQRIPGRSGIWSGKFAAVVATVAIGGAATIVGMGGDGSRPRVVMDPPSAPSATAPSTAGAPSPASPPDPASASSATPAQPSTTAPSKIKSATPTTPAPSRSTSSSSSAQDQVLALINKARLANGVPPLTRTDGLSRSAAAHTKLMAAGCGLSVGCPGEPDLGARQKAAGVSASTAAENIGHCAAARGSATALSDVGLSLTNEMLAEKAPDDGDRANLLNADFHHIGISLVQDASGVVWLTQDFSD